MQIDWLEGLETRVHEAAERLSALREENSTLRNRVQELEAALDSAAGEEALPLRERIRDLEAEAAGWAVEREEVRRRVQALNERLEALADL